MPGPSAAPVNFGAFGSNPALELANAIGGAVQEAPYQDAQLQSIGQQVLAPLMRQAQSDPYNPALIAKIRQVAQQYHLPPPIVGTPGGSWDSSGAGGQAPSGGAAPSQSAPATPATTAAPAGAPSPQTPSPGGAIQTGPAKPGMGFGSSASGSPATPAGPAAAAAQGKGWQDPRLLPLAQKYTALLQQAAANPGLLRQPAFDHQLAQAAKAVGRGPDEIKADIAAYQAKVKAGIQPGGGHPAAAPAGAGAPAAAGTGQPSQGAPAGPTAAQAPLGGAPAAQPGPESQPSVAAAQPGAPNGSYFRPANEGPLRVDINSWLGPLSAQDFASLSGMPPEERIAFLRQQGRDLNGFDQTWLHSNPSLTPPEQITLAHDAATAIGNDIRDGATPDQIKLSVATYRPYLTPAQNAELDSNITDSLDGALRIRQDQVQQTGFLRAQTLNLMNRKFAAQQSNVAWDHNYKYTVLNDKNAQWSVQQQTRQQNATTQAGRLQEEIARDQANGLVDDSGRPIKGGGGGIKPGELINSARGLLTSINSAVNEYNTRLQNALQNPGKTGVNAPMEADIQNQIDAYNQLVDQMDARGMHYFKHYVGPDQGAMSANTAAAAAANAVGAQGQTTPGPSAQPRMPGWRATAQMPDGRQIGKVNGKWYYADGTPVRP